MKLLSLFLIFFKIGAFTFGGGYAMLPMIEQEVEAHGWMREEELVNFIAVSEATPGPFAINISTYVGTEVGGLSGAIAATLGVSMPAFLLMLVIAGIYTRFQEYWMVKGMMKGLRPAVVGLIAAAMVSVGGQVFIGSQGTLIFSALVFLLGIFLELRMKLHPILPPLFSFDQYVWESKLAEMNVAMTRNIASQSKTFGDCKEQLLKWPNILKKIQAEYKIDLSDCYDILATSEAMLAITYMSLDLCSTLKLYFNSSLPLERAIALSRMNIICYSIIDRVYGYTSRVGSYWERYLTKPYGEDALPNVLLEIRDVMETCIKTNLYSNEKRLAFVHLKEENFISAIKMLYTQNPLKRD